MPLPLDDFLHSLARFMVTRAAALSPAVTIPYGGATGELFRWEAYEQGNSSGLYSVLSVVGGPPSAAHPKPTLSIECKTRGSNNKTAVARAEALFETLLEDDGRPIRLRSIDGFAAANDSPNGHWILANVVWTQRPGLAGRDQRGRVEVVFKLEVDAYKQD